MTRLDRKIDDLSKRARAKSVGKIPLVDLSTWPEADQTSYNALVAAGDDMAADAMITERYGEFEAGEGVSVIIVRLSPGTTDEDDDD